MDPRMRRTSRPAKAVPGSRVTSPARVRAGTATTAFLGLGGNLGDRQRQLAHAIQQMGQWPATRLAGVSSLYETAFQGPGSQPPYLNACVRLLTGLAPLELLLQAQDLQRRAGRPPDTHMIARSLDVDVLLYGRHCVSTAELTVPHPRVHERRFVLEPLCELEPDLWLPGVERAVGELLSLPDIARQRVECVAGAGWWQEAFG
jgi:2-amino-4-hydroxy-6-hydroxymethyldihydropteridine diphosphokinase